MAKSDYDNRNRIALWKNEDREKDTHPTHRGHGEVVCDACKHVTEVWASGWVRRKDQSEKAPAMSISIEPKDAKYLKDAVGKDTAAPPEDFDDDIPF